MFKTKRKRAVALALIAFFCVGATSFVAVDWKRFGGGFLAFLRGKGDPVVATGASSGEGGSHQAAGDAPPAPTAAPLQVAIASTRKHTSGASHGTGGGKSDEDLFKYGDPAAGGGIPPGSFIVAQNDNNGGGNGGSPAPAPGPASPAVTSEAPAPGGDSGGGGSGGGFATPAGSNPGGGDTGLPPSTSTPAAPTPPVSPSPPVSPTPSPSAPAPAPGQSGSTDPGTPTPPPPSIPSTPSAVPEASNLAMMSLGALFLAVAATRRRKNA